MTVCRLNTCEAWMSHLLCTITHSKHVWTTWSSVDWHLMGRRETGVNVTHTAPNKVNMTVVLITWVCLEDNRQTNPCVLPQIIGLVFKISGCPMYTIKWHFTEVNVDLDKLDWGQIQFGLWSWSLSRYQQHLHDNHLDVTCSPHCLLSNKHSFHLEGQTTRSKRMSKLKEDYALPEQLHLPQCSHI